MVQRVLQRIDLVLERRLHEAIEQLILEQADALLPRLREEIELVVRESVTQAFEQESACFFGAAGELQARCIVKRACTCLRIKVLRHCQPADLIQPRDAAMVQA